MKTPHWLWTEGGARSGPRPTDAFDIGCFAVVALVYAWLLFEMVLVELVLR